MEISNYWDTVPDYTGTEAAYLILGIEPEQKVNEPLSSFNHLYRRMNLAFIDTCAHYRYCTENERDWDAIGPAYWNGEELETNQLASVQMITLANQCLDARGDSAYCAFKEFFLGWLDQAIDQFESQRFSREELRYWLGVNQIASHYAFQMEVQLSPEERRAAVKELLIRYDGNKSAVAQHLGISRQRVAQLVAEKPTSDRNPLRNTSHNPFGVSIRKSEIEEPDSGS